LRPDWQRSRVYAWEDRVVAPEDPGQVAFPAAQGMVDAIWGEMGLRYPPRVERLPEQARSRVADATRLTLRLRPATPSWCLLHELAHAMTTDHDGRSDGHGAAFLGVYIGLLGRYLRLDEAELVRSAEAAGLQVQRGAQPVFLDADRPASRRR
jgi:hypothetical protein